jgi:hypothetical protein
MTTLDIMPDGQYVFKGLLIAASDTEHLRFDNPIMVVKDFDYNSANIIGQAELGHTNDGIKADLKLKPMGMLNLNLTPGIAYRVEEKVLNQKTGETLITKGQIVQVSLCSTPNQDPRIKSLYGQIQQLNVHI